MTEPYQPKTDALRALYWREEILQVMFWIQGEGFGDAVDLATLGRFLGIESEEGLQHVDRLVVDGYLDERAGLYSLTDKGRQDGARVFADEFAELTKPSHGECGPDCWCHSSHEEAEACAAERQHVGGHA